MSQPIEIAVRSDVGDAVRGLDRVDGKMGKMGRGAGILGKAVAGGLLAATVAIGAWGVTSVQSLARIEVINTQTASAIKSTGGAAGVTAQHVANLTGRLENLTATEAESIQEGANLLLTFTNIRNETGKGNAIFDRATSTITDMSRALGQDLKSSAIQVGKSLNDPIKGVTALQRVGVSFTADQKDQIKTLVESGHTLKAQKIILGELNKEFGGSGKAFASTTTGKIELAKHAFGTLGETIFAKLLPPLGDLAVWATKGLTALNDGARPVAGFSDTVENRLAPALKVAVAYGGLMADYYLGLAHIFTGDVLPVLIETGTYVATTFGPILGTVAGIIISDVIPGVRTFAAYVRGDLLPIVGSLAHDVGANLKPVLDQTAATIRGDVLPAVQQGADKFREWWPTIQRVGIVVTRASAGFIKFQTAITGRVLPVVIRLAGFVLRNMVPAILFMDSAVIGIIGGLIRFGGRVKGVGDDIAGFARGAKNRIGDLVTTVTGIPARIDKAVSNLGDVLFDEGRDLISGLISGIIDRSKDIASTIQGYVIDKIPGPVRKALGIESPSKVFRAIGRFITGGLVLGIRDGGPEIERTMNGLATRIRMPDGRVRIYANERPNRPAFSAAASHYSNGRRRGPVVVELTAEQMSALERGRKIKADLSEWEGIGG